MLKIYENFFLEYFAILVGTGNQTRVDDPIKVYEVNINYSRPENRGKNLFKFFKPLKIPLY